MIDIKPITVLVGNNSSGKSSLIRILSVLKQSALARLSGPITFVDPVADYGNIENIKNHNHSDEPIIITLDYGNISNSTLFAILVKKYRAYPFSREFNLSIVLNINGNGVETFLDKFEIHINSDVFIFKLDNAYLLSISYNDFEYDFTKYKLRWSYNKSFIPYFNIDQQDMFKQDTIYYDLYDSTRILNSVLKRTAINKISPLVHGNLDESTISNFIYQYRVLSDLDLHNRLEQKNDLGATFKNKYRDSNVKNQHHLRNSININKIAIVYDLIMEYMQRDALQISYIGPVRSLSSRYYSIKNTSVSEIDSDGSNTAMFINGLSKDELSSFQRFTYDYFGFEMDTQKTFDFTSLIITEKNSSKPVNLSDVGSGYSQILPIILNLWKITNNDTSTYRGNKIPFNRNMRNSYLFVVEQPELHLHPYFQAQLLDFYVKITTKMKENGIDLYIIFETHSQTMINRLGLNIMYEKISADQIGIYLFDKNENGETKICQKPLNNDGTFHDWPQGFFAPPINNL